MEEEQTDAPVGQFYGPIDQLDTGDIPPAYVGNWLLKGSLSVLFGRAGAGKTILAQELVHCLRAGGDWLGQPVQPIGDDPADILWINGDLRAWQIGMRLRSLMGPPAKVVIWQALQTCLLENLETFLDRAAQAKFVIFDHRGALFRIPDANVAENWSEMNDALITLCDLGVTLIMLTHEAKAGTGAAFGSSAQEWPVDTMIRTGARKPTKRDEDLSFEIGSPIPPYEVEWTKSRLCAAPERVPYRIDLDPGAKRLRPIWREYEDWK